MYNADKKEKEALVKGIEATVEILDKERVSNVVMVGKVATTQITHVLKVYVHKEVRDITVDGAYYKSVNKGDEINVKLYEDRLVIIK